MTWCKLCNKEVRVFLTHLVLTHDINSEEQYEELVKKEELEKRKTEIYQSKIRELVKKLNKKEITTEQYRNMIGTIKR
jgi:translation initiation factor IF-2